MMVLGDVVVVVSGETWILIGAVTIVGSIAIAHFVYKEFWEEEWGKLGAFGAVLLGIALLVPFAVLANTAPTPKEALEEICVVESTAESGHVITERLDDPLCR